MRLSKQKSGWLKWSIVLLLVVSPFTAAAQPAGASDIGILEIPFPGATGSTRSNITDTDIRVIEIPSVGVEGEPKREPAGQSDPACNNLASCLAYVVYIFTVGLGSAVAYIGALIFSFATVLTLSSTAYALTFLSEGWTIVRDIANMFFILILVYIAFTVMFRADTPETMKRLAWVIVIALIINFSFFFVRVVIDAGNLVAIQFYNAIPAQPLVETKEQGGIIGIAANVNQFLSGQGETKDLTSVIMNGVGAHTILSTKSFQAFQDNRGFIAELLALVFVYIALGAILFILAAAFFTVGIKFIVRTVILWLVLISAPVALIANTVQQGKEWYQKWQKALIAHAFYPAVFLFIFYILTLFMEQLTQGGTVISSTFTEIETVNERGLAFIVPLIAIIGIKLGFVIALIYIGLQVSERLGVMGAQLAQKVTGRAFGAAGWAAAWPTGKLGRGIVGGAGYGISRSAWLAERAQRTGIQGWPWRRVEGGARRLSTASFDLRNARGAGLVKKGVEKLVGGPVPTGKPGGEGGIARSIQERQERQDRLRRERAAIIRDAANRELLNRIASNLSTGTANNPADEDRLRNFTRREIELVEDRHLEALGRIITENQLRTFTDSERFTDTQKERTRLAFQENSSASPLVRGQNIVINELRQLNANLRTTNIGSINARNTTVDRASIAAMLADVNNATATLNSRIRSAPRGADTTDMQHDLGQLRNTVRSLDRLEEERRRVSANPTVGRANSGEFTVL